MTTSTTTHVARKPLTNAMHGERFARSLGTPLNEMVTINFDCLGISDADAGDLFKSLRERVSRAWTYRRTQLANMPIFMWVYVHENPDGKRNVHWLVHVPHWFRKSFRAIVTDRLSELTAHQELGAALHFGVVNDQAKVMKYVGKGVHPTLGEYFHIKVVKDPGDDEPVY